MTTHDTLDPITLYESMQARKDTLSLDAVQFILSELEQNPQGIVLTFNGGKDCVVVLHLFRIALALFATKHSQLRTSTSSSTPTCRMLWFTRSDEFIELRKFVEEQITIFEISPVRKDDDDYKSGLTDFCADCPEVRSCLMGQRLTDPYCQDLELKTHCSSGWPDIWRLNPILYWRYCDVWRFIDSYHVPYCQLYDQGYTSLGPAHSTIPNPLLFIDEQHGFRPARELEHDFGERFGRIVRPKSGTSRIVDDRSVAIIILHKSNSQESQNCLPSSFGQLILANEIPVEQRIKIQNGVVFGLDRIGLEWSSIRVVTENISDEVLDTYLPASEETPVCERKETKSRRVETLALGVHRLSSQLKDRIRTEFKHTRCILGMSFVKIMLE